MLAPVRPGILRPLDRMDDASVPARSGTQYSRGAFAIRGTTAGQRVGAWKVHTTRAVVPQLLLADLLSPDRIKIPLESTDKVGLIGELTTLLAAVSGVPEEEDTIRAAVLEREAVLSTGVGGGLAIPHGKSGAVSQLVLVAGRTAEPVDFESLDSQPVRLVMLLVGPESAAGLHVKVLSRISRILHRSSVAERLTSAATPDEFLAAIRDAESR